MKKHLLGFTIFSLIVGGAAVISALFAGAAIPSAGKSFNYEVSKRSCWRGARRNPENLQNSDNGQSSIKVTQAVLNEKTRRLDTDFFIQRETPSTQSVSVRLTFVSGLSNGNDSWDGIVRTEDVTLTPDFGVDNRATDSTVLSYKWLDNLETKDNLYVRAEILNSRSTKQSANFSYKINDTNFTPVLLMNKNRNY